MFKHLPSRKAYTLLESGPIVLLTTAGSKGHNVMTLGFHMMVQHEPALVACVIGPWNHSHTALRESGECVISVPTVDLAEQVTRIGNCSGQDVDKFATFGLHASPASTVNAPLIEECIANLECKVADTALVEPYNMFILEVSRIRVDRFRRERRLIHHAGNGAFIVDGDTVDMRQHMTKWRYLMD
ncbi:flavin reductase family protein [Massilia sp. DD77]|uniref:flavin reductase family protein n=1 Tax=Massilia sp. DD77 TaxID=3109349 RepID=UPI002FFEEDF1